MSSEGASSAVTYTFISSEARSWSIPTEDPYEEAARQALEQASPPSSPAYVPDPMKLEDHPLTVDASPAALPSGYIVDSDPEEDEEDPVNYPADERDDDDDESSDDDVEEDEDEEEEHLAPADSTAVDHTPIPFPFEEEVAMLLALPTPPPSPLTSLSSLLP
uniref:Uncharacterized protein n=1 Tax=Tanacetum cinerariifolium TaxID=118510 RepID=A0A6L2MR71_TANCI|nr:hypothetical protein [Tanacetum cinerariifolium]